jgi:hypothetical protein
MKRTADRLTEIAQRKERLMRRAEAQRAAIAGSVEALRGPIRIADKGLEMVRFLRVHPVIVGVALAVVVVLRGRGVVSLVGRGLAIWRVWRSLSAWAAGRLV